MVARNELEKKVLEMVKNGEKIKGWALDILIDMSIDEENNKK